MRQVTQVTKEIVDAFLNGIEKVKGNTRTDGKSLFLHGNKIAEKRSDGLYITNAGWTSKTTKERLNGLPNVHIHQQDFVWYLNGTAWEGNWIKVV